MTCPWSPRRLVAEPTLEWTPYFSNTRTRLNMDILLESCSREERQDRERKQGKGVGTSLPAEQLQSFSENGAQD